MAPPEPSLVWRDTFRVRAYETDKRLRLRFPALCNYLQESAAAHAQSLGVAVEELHSRNMTWVISRFHIRVTAYPRWRQDIAVETWPSAVSSLFALRDFKALDETGRSLAVATTSWMVIDLEKRKPVPIPDFITRLHGECPGRALADPFERLPSLERVASQGCFEVRHSDLDLNRHVNFVRTIELGLEPVPDELREERQVADLEIAFRAESGLGDRILVQAGPLAGEDPLRLGHILFRERDGQELARMTTRWSAAS